MRWRQAVEQARNQARGGGGCGEADEQAGAGADLLIELALAGAFLVTYLST